MSNLRTKRGVFLLGLMALLAACNPAPGPANADASQASSDTSQPAAAASGEASVDWNVKDPNAMTNGNIGSALARLRAGEQFPKSGPVKAAAVLKAPWKSYGKTLCFSGEVINVAEFPPGSELYEAVGGDASEVVFIAEDETIVDAMVMESSGDLEDGAKVTVCGVAAGSAEVPNKLGGNFTHLVLVGKIE